MKNRPIFSLVLSAIFAGSAFFSCKKTTSHTNITPDHAGCMDSYATNYDPAANVAATCHYTIDVLAGDYAVVDSYFYLKPVGPLSYIPDTIVTLDTITVTTVAHDSVSFDKIIRHGSPSPTHFKINMTDTTFGYYASFSDGYTTATGSLAGNRIDYLTESIYSVFTSSTNSRHVKGHKIN